MPLGVIAEHLFIHPSGPSGLVVEMFVHAPRTDRGRPAVLFVHGHQEGERIGGRDWVEAGVVERFASQYGFVAASVSQPGYGGSSGPPDWCGPASQGAIRAALAVLRRRREVDPSRLMLFGVSRGAIASSMAATEEPDLRALVLIAGLYDLASAFPHLPPLIRAAVAAEAGTTPDAFAARSALLHVARIRAATLILHGRFDERCPVSQAEALAAAMQRRGGNAVLALVDSGHIIPLPARRACIESFLVRFGAG